MTVKCTMSPHLEKFSLFKFVVWNAVLVYYCTLVDYFEVMRYITKEWLRINTRNTCMRYVAPVGRWCDTWCDMEVMQERLPCSWSLLFGGYLLKYRQRRNVNHWTCFGWVNAVKTGSRSQIDTCSKYQISLLNYFNGSFEDVVVHQDNFSWLKTIVYLFIEFSCLPDSVLKLKYGFVF